MLAASFARQEVRVMKDYQAYLEKLRKDAAECALIRDLATDPAKRTLFDTLYVHLSSLADQVEQEMLHWKPSEKGRSGK
jgi:hypothetical protein